jgi:hypothetical protein
MNTTTSSAEPVFFFDCSSRPPGSLRSQRRKAYERFVNDVMALFAVNDVMALEN